MRLVKTIVIATFLFFHFMVKGQNPIPMGPYIGQEPKRSIIHTILSKFRLGIGTGYGRTYYSHKMEDVAFLRKSDTLFIFDPATNISGGSIPAGYTGWFNNPVGHTAFVVGTDTISNPGISIDANDALLSTDTADIKMKSRARTIPLNFTLEFNYQKYRIGIGYQFEFQSMNSFEPKEYADTLIGFTPEFKRATFKRYYLMLGYSFYESGHFKAVADAKIGKMKFGKHYNTSVIQSGIFFNLGVTAEWQFSEYLTAYARPAFEYKSYTVAIPETTYSFNHIYPALFLEVGIKLGLPNLRKCPIVDCATQINHVHWGTEYRSRKHPFWKWQNPHYGENYKNLIKYKGRNKRKINPY
ncbi:MAG TPA: hypothetical protein VGA21_15690 [Cyclobacteriaceae bacterium]